MFRLYNEDFLAGVMYLSSYMVLILVVDGLLEWLEDVWDKVESFILVISLILLGRVISLERE